QGRGGQRLQFRRANLSTVAQGVCRRRPRRRPRRAIPWRAVSPAAGWLRLSARGQGGDGHARSGGRPRAIAGDKPHTGAAGELARKIGGNGIPSMGAMRTLFLLLCIPMAGAGAAGPNFSDVFVSDKEGYKSIRIPSVVVTKTGVVLAFAEGRASGRDQAQNNIILKRS